MQENAQVIEDWKPCRLGERQAAGFAGLLLGSVGAACGRVCRLPAGAAAGSAGLPTAYRPCSCRLAAGVCRLLQGLQACCRVRMLAAGLQGLQVAAVLHAGSAERRPDLESYLEIARTRSLKSLEKDACLRSQALACASEPPMAMLDAEGWSDMTNVLQHCHWGKGIFDNAY